MKDDLNLLGAPGAFLNLDLAAFLGMTIARWNRDEETIFNHAQKKGVCGLRPCAGSSLCLCGEAIDASQNLFSNITPKGKKMENELLAVRWPSDGQKKLFVNIRRTGNRLRLLWVKIVKKRSSGFTVRWITSKTTHGGYYCSHDIIKKWVKVCWRDY